MKTALWVDDIRNPPNQKFNWHIARNFHEAIYMLESIDYDAVSLDHDIASFYGNKEMTGRDILNWLIERKINQGKVWPREVFVHSANPVGCDTMEADIKRFFTGE